MNPTNEKFILKNIIDFLNPASENFILKNIGKVLNDIFTKYQREKLEKRRDEILAEEIKEVDLEKKKQLSKELNDIILKLVKIK